MTLSLASLNPFEAQIQTAAACVADNILISLAGEQRNLCLLPDGIPLNECEAAIPLQIDGHSIILRFSKCPVSGEILKQMGVTAFPELPTPLQQMVIERAINTDLDRFEKLSGYRVKFDETGIKTDRLPVKVPFSMGAIQGDLCAPAEAAPLLITILQSLPRKKFQNEMVPISLGIEAGRTLLDVNTIRDLQRGDVILIKTGPNLKNNQIEIRPSHSMVYRGQLRGSEIKIESYMNVDTEHLSEYDNASEAETGNIPARRDSVTPVDQIPVTAVFELGRRQITVGDLDQLQPGAVLELENPVEDAEVIIRVNGKAIATGRLAEIAGNLAVKIEEV